LIQSKVSDGQSHLKMGMEWEELPDHPDHAATLDYIRERAALVSRKEIYFTKR